ncbi:MAG: Clp1/GlmU family protein [Candidatus Caldarchaeum sp.]|nr:Clp1/GlmU family protein [Candidatus Caldarchaeum sp.]MCX8201716.1 Clp1/GlmU family protein [Candidatus Caldarchaeum sp.]MDW8062962.1 Clp1/GlmU family protein [Candidatus Caldarchaeum sp.]MDW8435215.1 Clp1/GlmU family protein [Candidatus Caldarchaeum sp.]
MDLAADKTLLVEGPSAVKVVQGSVSIYGCRLIKGRTYVLRPGRRYPLYAEQDSKVEINLGSESHQPVVESGSTVVGWRDAVEQLSNEKVMAVCGPVDSGKTSFCTYAANLLVQKHGRCVVVSLDPGQSYFTPPTVVGAAVLQEPVHDLFTLKPFIQIPVGSTSAASCATAVAQAAEALVRKIPDDVCVVVDVDGWVDGAPALSHKTMLLKIMNCSSAVVLGNEQDALKNALTQAGIRVMSLPTSSYVRQRDYAERKKTREWLYRRFLGKPSLKLVPTTWATVDTICRRTDASSLLEEAANSLAETLGIRPEANVDPESTMSKRKIGLLAYIYDGQNTYRGLGLYLGMNRERNVHRLFSSVEVSAHRILLGKVVLSIEGDEILQLD